MPLSPESPGLELDGSDPESESSVPTTGSPLLSRIGSPFSSIASPEPTIWLTSGFAAPAAARSTTTLNSMVTESPIAKVLPAAASCVSAFPSNALLAVKELPVAVAGETTAAEPALINAEPYWPLRSSNKEILARSTVPVFSTTT